MRASGIASINIAKATSTFCYRVQVRRALRSPCKVDLNQWQPGRALARHNFLDLPAQFPVRYRTRMVPGAFPGSKG